MYNFVILENSLSVTKHTRESSFLAYKRKRKEKRTGKNVIDSNGV